MLMWDPMSEDDDTPTNAPAILFISGAALDHALYALPTIEKNAIDYFCEAGCRSYFQQFVNQLLRFYPVGSARETCRSVTCHRTQLAFGRLWSHENLNEATHRYADRFLGGTSMNSTGWLLNSGRADPVTGNAPSYDNLLSSENIDRLKGVPILFLSGSENMIYTPENTDTSYTALRNAHGRHWYEREVIIGRGHTDAWMGATAYLDVYPRVKRHVDKFMTVK